MASYDVAPAVATINKLLAQEAINLSGVEEEVDRLQTELKWMQSFLIEADAKRAEDQRIKLWVSEIRNLVYEAENVIVTFALKVASKRKGGFSNVIKISARVLKGGMLYKTRSEIEKIIAKIDDLTRRIDTDGIRELRIIREEPSSSNGSQVLRESYPHIIQAYVVGLDDEIKKLVSVVIDDNRECPVVSICGMGGLGKTTLAKKLYQHNRVRDQFNYRAWVYVSQQCQKRKVWEDILSNLTFTNETGSKQSDEELAEKLFNFLKNNKCLVILDDIWSTQAWDIIKPGFPTTKKTSSKILLTSRNNKVPSDPERRAYVHELQCLKEEESWELFQKIAFPDRDSADYKVDAKMEELGKDMVKHCAGLPLAITVLGGILATKYSSIEWQIVNRDVKSYLKRGQAQGIEEVLALSYDNLPPHLKPCFLYLSHFPEDYEIHAYRLIQLWVASGIVSSTEDEGNGEEILEDVAECCLNELVARYMIRPEKRDAITGKIKTCQMYDLMRDLCLSKAKEENFLYIIDHSNAYPRHNYLLPFAIPSVAAHEYVRVQCIQNQEHLQSLLFFDEFFPKKLFLEALPKNIGNYLEDHANEDVLDPLTCVLWFLLMPIYLTKMRKDWRYIFNKFKLLRVLDFECISDAGWKLPRNIGNLIHLKFLSLRKFSFLRSKLPSSLGNLRWLQTLDLRVVSEFSSVHVPNVIWKMEQLRHLYLPEKCNRKTKLRLDTLKNLQTLVNFNTKNCYLTDLQHMKKLRVLMICEPFRIENQLIIDSESLHTLCIESNNIDPRQLAHILSRCVHICKFIGSIKGRMELPENHFSSKIAYIHLSDSEIEEDPMPTLEKLHNLRILELHNSVYRGGEMVCSAQHFLRLDSLSLCGLHYLEEWRVGRGAMPALRHLEIESCPELKMLPDGLKFITTLQELKIKSMPKAFKDKVVEGGDDFDKVQHVPSIIFQNCDD